MTPERQLAFHNAVAANGGIINDEIRKEFQIAKPADDKSDNAPAPIVEIPANFAELDWKELQALVKEVTGKGPENKPDAIAKLTEEVERRAAEADGNNNGGDNGDA